MTENFNCPKCLSIENSVKDSRFRDGNRHRRRECNSCGHRYTTTETVVESEVAKGKSEADIEAWNNLGGTTNMYKIDKATVEIEKFIPIPEPVNVSMWVFTKAMGIGDSILVENDKAAGACHYMKRTYNFKVVTRKKEDGKTRIWRTA